MSKLAEDLLINAEHLRYSILVLSTEGATEQTLMPLRQQLTLVDALDLEVSAFCYNIEKEGLHLTDVIKYTDRIDEIRSECQAFLKQQKHIEARTCILSLKEERRAFRRAMADRKASRS